MVSHLAIVALTGALGASPGPQVPSPGLALLLDTSPFVTARLLLAQADDPQGAMGQLEMDMKAAEAGGHPDPKEEKKLEEDMKKARKKLGKQRTPVRSKTSGQTPRSFAEEEEMGVSPRRDRGYQRSGDDYQRSEEVKAERDLLYEGHGKVYYLVWGLVDWGITAGLWAASAVFWVYTAVVGAVIGGSSNVRASDAGAAAAVLGGIAVGLGAGGAITAWRAGVNIGTWRHLKAGRLPN